MLRTVASIIDGLLYPHTRVRYVPPVKGRVTIEMGQIALTAWDVRKQNDADVGVGIGAYRVAFLPPLGANVKRKLHAVS